MDYLCKSFSELSTKELFGIYFLRNKVFVVEQSCAYQDVDEIDMKAHHLMIIEKEKLIAYCRIYFGSLDNDETRIGRVVVAEEFRKKGIGKELMHFAIDKSKELFAQHIIVLSAQMYLITFYENLKFKTTGVEFLEDGIPHINMKHCIVYK